MRRDTQIGIILGAVILVIIGVFLSTRTSVKGPQIPTSTMTEEEVSEIEEIDISDLVRESQRETTKHTEAEETSSEDTLAAEAEVDDTLIEGGWQGVEAEVVDGEDALETSTDKEFKEILTTIQEVSEEISEGISEDDIVVLEEQQYTFDTKEEVTHKVMPNDSLSNLSKEYYGDMSKWREIFNANKDKIANPDTLRVGVVLIIPDITASREEKKKTSEVSSATESVKQSSSTSRTHKVRTGDTLYKLAKKYYDDYSMWDKIYDANEDTIQSKNSLKVGQILIIPE